MRDGTELTVRAYTERDRTAVIELWERCGLTRSWNDPNRDIDRKVTADAAGFLVGVVDGTVVATIMAGYDGHRGWVNYVGVDPQLRGGGHGALMMRAAEDLLGARGCPKVNLQIRTSNLDAVRFYESIGYIADDVVSMSRRLTDD